MLRRWIVHRQVKETEDAQRRWDRAYQLLLQWEAPSQREREASAEEVSGGPGSTPSSAKEAPR
jgi:hypothetical protein